jgi:hypothetical protein
MGDYTPDVAGTGVPTLAGKQVETADVKPPSGVLYHQLRREPLNIIGGRGSYLITDTGLEILDATSGAAVSCLGHSDERVHEAILEQLKKIPYCYSMYFTNSAAEGLSKLLVDSTGGKMSRAYIVSSGKDYPYTRTTTVAYISGLIQVPRLLRQPSKCLSSISQSYRFLNPNV